MSPRQDATVRFANGLLAREDGSVSSIHAMDDADDSLNLVTSTSMHQLARLYLVRISSLPLDRRRLA